MSKWKAHLILSEVEGSGPNLSSRTNSFTRSQDEGSNSPHRDPVALLYDLAAAVGLLAGGAVALLGLAAHSDGLLELAAIGPVGGLVIVSRHHRAGGPGLLVAPRQGLAWLAGLERGLRRPVGIGDIGLIERFADLIAQQAAGDDTDRGRRPFARPAAELVAEEAAETGADERSAGRLFEPDVARPRPGAVGPWCLAGRHFQTHVRPPQPL